MSYFGNVNTAIGIVGIDSNDKIHALDGSQLINLATSQLSGVVTIAQGGTNSATTLSNNSLMYSTSGAIKELGTMTDGQIVVGVSSGAPSIVSMSGAGTLSSLGVLTLSSSSVTGQVLTGFSVGANSTILSTDTVLQAFAKTQGQINAVTGSLVSSITGTTDEIIVSSSTGAITLSTPQPIALTSDVQFNTLSLAATNNQLILQAGGSFTATISSTPTANVTMSIPAASNSTAIVPSSGTSGSTFISNISSDGVLTYSTPLGANILAIDPVNSIATDTVALDTTLTNMYTYINTAIQGLDIKPACQAATVANIALDGSVTIVDGVTLTNGLYILVKNQTNTTENGIYVISSSAWVFASFWDAPDENGAITFIANGSINNSTSWVCTDGGVGSATIFTQFSGAGSYTAGTGLVLSGTQFSIDGSVVNSVITSSTANLFTGAISSNALTLTLASGSQNLVFATPDGSSGVGSYRSIVLTDLPTISIAKGGTNSTTALTGQQIMISDSSGTSIVEGGVLLDGQLMIGSSAGIPAAGSLTSSGTILFTTGTNTLALDVNVGTGANQIVQLDSSGNLPAINGSGITNLSSSNMLVGTVTLTDSTILDTDSANVAFGKLQAQINAVPSNSQELSYATTSVDITQVTTILLVTATGRTITLPVASSVIPGQLYTIKLGNFVACTIAGNGSDTIDDASTYLLTNYWAVTMFSDGVSNWSII